MAADKKVQNIARMSTAMNMGLLQYRNAHCLIDYDCINNIHDYCYACADETINMGLKAVSIPKSCVNYLYIK